MEKPKVKFCCAESPMGQSNGLLHFSVLPRTTFTETAEVWGVWRPPTGPSHPLIAAGWVATRHTLICTTLHLPTVGSSSTWWYTGKVLGAKPIKTISTEPATGFTDLFTTRQILFNNGT